jgi:hypothetical protein
LQAPPLDCEGPTDGKGKVSIRPECGEQKRRALERSLEKFSGAYAELAKDEKPDSCGEERPADQGVTHAPFRATLPVFVCCTFAHGSMEKLVYTLVAADSAEQARDLTGDERAEQIDGLFFNGAGPRVLRIME